MTSTQKNGRSAGSTVANTLFRRRSRRNAGGVASVREFPFAGTLPLASVLEVLRALRAGDFDVALPNKYVGMAGELAQTLNDVIEQNRRLSSELQRLSRVVGKEGKLEQRAVALSATGTWQASIEAVNALVDDLVQPTKEVGRVIGAVASGDLSKTMLLAVDNRPLRGEFLGTATLVNGMVRQLGSFASEVTRVAREVGTEGKLGGQANVPGLAGTWKDLTDSVNSMAGNLTAQVRNIAEVTTAVAKGDLSKKITVDVQGEILQLKDTINTMVDQLNSFASELTRVAREVGTEGKLGGQARVPGVSGTWKDLTDSVNSMASNLTAQVRNIAEVTTAVARGDLSRKITVDVRGEILELKDTTNTMVDQLNAFASEVTRVAREVGTEGALGGQARVPGVAGIWMDLTDNVNSMASNLTNQVRGIATVVTAVAKGDLTRKLALDARGEIAELADTINGMTDTLAIFAEQVSSVASEVGAQGKLGGQAKVPGVAGTWRELTDNVNELAANLTTQVRAIGDVATAVTKGDLTRYITVEASGEVAALKDHVNEMIRNLKETTQKTTEQDWLKTNLARFSRMLQGQRDLFTVARQILSELTHLVSAQHGLFFIADADSGETELKLLASYAAADRLQLSFKLGEGLVGQCALEKRKILLTSVPPRYLGVPPGQDNQIQLSLVILPVLFEGQINAVIELASFEPLSPVHEDFLEQLTESIGIVVNTIAAGMRTEGLLQQSQSLTRELQTQQEELRQTNERLERQAKTLRVSEERLRQQQEQMQRANELLEDKAKLLEVKNQEVEYARAELEEKAEQLALTSRYKSEFLANMSHELRTPLNSLLILSEMLSDNREGNLTSKQVEFSRTIHSAGTDLLTLISDILDLSKIESGTITVEASEVRLADLAGYVEQNFRHVAQRRGLEFRIELDERVPSFIVADAKRLQQVLKNLLSNAFKFTEQGHVTFRMSKPQQGWRSDHPTLSRAKAVVAFSVLDTGVGIAEHKQRIIFEAFQQADGTTSRRYGGTGLGLSISRELARLLGGELCVVSRLGEGSTFTFYVPDEYREERLNEPYLEPVTDLNERPTDPLAQSLPLASLSHAGLSHAGLSHAGLSHAGLSHSASSSGLLALLDDREAIGPQDRVLLIVEDDPSFAQILLNLARVEGFKGVVAANGALAIDYAFRHHASAITLNIALPDIDGWSVLGRLKRSQKARHVPVVVFAARQDALQARKMGAHSFIEKPSSPEVVERALRSLARFTDAEQRRLLIADADPSEREAVAELLFAPDLQITQVDSVSALLSSLKNGSFDCVLLELGLLEAGKLELATVRRVADDPHLALIVRAKRTLARRESSALQRQAEALIVSGVRCEDRMLRETSLFLHRQIAQLPEAQRRRLVESESTLPELDGAKILVVDDDVRNIFAMTSALERHRAQVIYAENGREGLELLQRGTDVDAVLMDVMMPEMDGYKVMRLIRADDRFEHLPLIAVTAKAMAADRDKCIEAGASDYVSKPVDMDQLLSLLRVRLAR